MTDFSFLASQIQGAVWECVSLMTAPAVLYRPRIYPDGNKWCALLGDDLMTGVAGFGDTPAKAVADFNRAFAQETPPKVGRSAP